MSIKPILFNTEMVKAILDGRKTCTRRVVKHDKADAVLNSPARKANPDIPDEQFIKCLVEMPYEVGDILYVRETWCDDRQFTREDTPGMYFYKASADSNFDPKWKPSIHMPKEAARIWLKVTDVRVERLQDIDIDGIRNEGLPSMAVHAGDMEIALKEWKILWDSTIKKSDTEQYGWDANPWVWVIEFERCDQSGEG